MKRIPNCLGVEWFFLQLGSDNSMSKLGGE